MATKQELLDRLAECVLEMEEEEVVEVAQEYLDAGYPAYDGIMQGLAQGMGQASVLYEEEEYFVTDLLLCSDAMYAGIDVLSPHLDAVQTKSDAPKAVIGVVEGDTHDIGKNLVKIMMDTAGFDVIDLGRDVPLEKFVNTAEEVGARIIAMSTLMTSTMDGMRQVVHMLNDRGIREKYLIMVGGSPVSQGFATEIGADIYTQNATDAARAAKAACGMA